MWRVILTWGISKNVMLIPQVKPPFKPVVKFDTDVSNFDEDFTSEPVKLSPPEGKATGHERFEVQ